MNDAFESADERLRSYLDDENELRLDAVWRLDICAGALLDGLISPDLLAEGWPDWFELAPAFAAVYAPPFVSVFEARAKFLKAPGTAEHEYLTQDDRAYLELLRFYLKRYAEVRNVQE